MSDDLSKVDWGKPIEAYHEDGRVLGAVLHPHEPQPDEEGDYEIVAPGVVPTAYFREDGTPSPNGGGRGCGWRIRNVAEPVQPTPSDDIAKRMEALVRAMAARKTDPGGCLDITAMLMEADAIVGTLDGPVDADREEAKKIAAEWYSEEAPHIDPLTAALKRGRELAQKMKSLRRDESQQMIRALERDSREG